MAVGRVSAADGEVGPSRRVAGVGDAVCGGLEEVEDVDGRALDCAAQDDEELEDDSAGEQEERDEGEDGSWVALAFVQVPSCAFHKRKGRTSRAGHGGC